jgi:hypothetical protein
MFAAGCPEPSPEPPPPSVTDPVKLAEHVRTNYTHPNGKTTGIYVEEPFWVGEERSRETTVRATLIELGAALRDGKVVDAAGEELYFFWVQYPPSRPAGWKDYEEDQKKLHEMEKKYHVVRMYGPPLRK